MDISLQPLREEYRGPVLRLLGQLLPHARTGDTYSPERTEDYIDLLLERPDMGLGVIAIDETGDVVGCASALLTKSVYSDDTIAVEQGLLVLPEARGHGVAGRMLALLAAWARRSGAISLRAGNSLGMEDGAYCAIVKKEGFTITGSLAVKSL